MSYYTKITKAGLAAITAAMNNNSKVPITYMAFGDGNGYIPEPDENATSLVNEVYRAGVNKVEVHNKNPNWLVCEAIIPSAVGGFNIREVALYDNTGTKMLAIASYPPTYKPTVEEGAAKIQTIRIVIQVDNSGNFELIVDPDIVLATVSSVEDRIAKLNLLNKFGMKGDGVSDDSLAFIDLEAQHKNQVIDLLGKSYVVNEIFKGNEYINGYFVVGGIKQSSNNKLKSTSDLNLNKREIVATLRTYNHRDDYYQSVCYKEGVFYSIARRSGSESDRTEKMSFFAHPYIDNNSIVSCNLMSAETNFIGHQGLDWGYENGVARFFSSMGFAEANNGLYIASFDAPTINGGACANFVKYKVLKDTDPISKTLPTNISFSRDKSLFAVMCASHQYQRQLIITIFKADVLTGVDSDISEKYLYKFYVNKYYHPQDVGVCQDIALGDDRVYMSFARSNGMFIDICDFKGNFISREYHEVGKYYAEQLQTRGYSYEYEPEALVWVNDTLCLHAVLGYNSSLQGRANVIFNISKHSIIERSPKNKTIVANSFKVEAQNEFLQRDIPLQATTSTVTMIADATAGFYISKFNSPRQVYTLSANPVVGNGKSPYIGFYRDDDTSAVSGSLALICGKNGGSYGVHVDANNLSLSSALNNTLSLGRSASLWKDIYSANGVIQTSDERLKQKFRSQNEREKLAALEIKSSICLFKFNDAIDLKGDDARWHVGVKAQQVISILESHDLNHFDYAFVCFDEWEEQKEIIETWGDEYGDDGELIRAAGSLVIQHAQKAGNRYAIRYDELVMFILSAL